MNVRFRNATLEMELSAIEAANMIQYLRGQCTLDDETPYQIEEFFDMLENIASGEN